MAEEPRSPRSLARLPVSVAALPILILGFLRLPVHLAALGSEVTLGNQDGIIARLIPAFVASSKSGQPGATSDLLALQAYWVRFHLVKAAFALASALVIAWLARDRWRAGRVWGATVLSISGTFAVALLLANVQGALAPAMSLQSMLPLRRDGTLTATLVQLRAELLERGTTVSSSVHVERLVDEFAFYHWVFAVLAGGTAIILTIALLRWRQTPSPAARRARHARRVLRLGGAMTSVAFAVLCLANLSTALDPVHGLLGWLRL